MNVFTAFFSPLYEHVYVLSGETHQEAEASFLMTTYSVYTYSSWNLNVLVFLLFFLMNVLCCSGPFSPEQASVSHSVSFGCGGGKPGGALDKYMCLMTIWNRNRSWYFLCINLILSPTFGHVTELSHPTDNLVLRRVSISVPPPQTTE